MSLTLTEVPTKMLFRVGEAAEILEVHENTVRLWCEKGYLKVVKNKDGCPVIERDSIQQFLVVPEQPLVTLESQPFVQSDPQPLGTVSGVQMIQFEAAAFCSPCIYFLLDHDRCVLYVGKSVSLLPRLGQHAVSGKRFHSVAFVLVDAAAMEEEEAKFIRQYNPPLNKTTVTDEGKHVIKTRKMA